MDVLGRVYSILGEYDWSAPLLEQALADQWRGHGDLHPEVANSLAALVLLRYVETDYQAVERLSREAAEIYQTMGRTNYGTRLS